MEESRTCEILDRMLLLFEYMLTSPLITSLSVSYTIIVGSSQYANANTGNLERPYILPQPLISNFCGC